MNIYTSYFANINKLRANFKGNVAIISISRVTYNTFKVDGYLGELAPSSRLLADYRGGKVNWDEYTERFKEETLDYVDARDIVRRINEIAYGKDNAVLMCYESPEKNCHRHLVSDWLNSYGVECSEIILK